MEEKDILNIQSMFECLEKAVLRKTEFTLQKPITIDKLSGTHGKYSHILFISIIPDLESGDTLGINLYMGKNSKKQIIYNFKEWDTIYSRRFYELFSTIRKDLKQIFSDWWQDTLCVILSSEYKLKQIEQIKEELYMNYTYNYLIKNVTIL